jgi:hypothetical protein
VKRKLTGAISLNGIQMQSAVRGLTYSVDTPRKRDVLPNVTTDALISSKSILGGEISADRHARLGLSLPLQQ